MTTVQLDAADIPVRYTGEQYFLNGRKFEVIKNKGLAVLCPCPDKLLVRFLDTNEEKTIDNSKDFIPIPKLPLDTESKA